jgi:DNA-binding response OmpR family regulator
VLIIADGAREALELFATLEGCEAKVVSHGALAEEAILSWEPHAILVEFTVLGAEAEEILQHYRGLAPSYVPIVLVASERPGLRQTVGIGLAGVLVRPFAVGELLDLLDRIVGCR